MAPVLGSIFFTVVLGGAGTSLLMSLAEARDALFPLLRTDPELAPRTPRRVVSVRRRVQASLSAPQRAAA